MSTLAPKLTSVARALRAMSRNLPVVHGRTWGNVGAWYAQRLHETSAGTAGAHQDKARQIRSMQSSGLVHASDARAHGSA
eukprot:1301166-Prymnesium_polylepis.1